MSIVIDIKTKPEVSIEIRTDAEIRAEIPVEQIRPEYPPGDPQRYVGISEAVFKKLTD